MENATVFSAIVTFCSYNPIPRPKSSAIITGSLRRKRALFLAETQNSNSYSRVSNKAVESQGLLWSHSKLTPKRMTSKPDIQSNTLRINLSSNGTHLGSLQESTTKKKNHLTPAFKQKLNHYY